MNKQDKKYPKILTKKKCTIVEYKFIEILLSNINKEKCDNILYLDKSTISKKYWLLLRKEIKIIHRI